MKPLPLGLIDGPCYTKLSALAHLCIPFGIPFWQSDLVAAHTHDALGDAVAHLLLRAPPSPKTTCDCLHALASLCCISLA